MTVCPLISFPVERRFAQWILPSFVLLLSLAPVYADVTLATPFRDGLVLQRNKPAIVWGTAAPGEQIQVEFKGQTRCVTACKDGKWNAKLDAVSASVEPAHLVVTGKNTRTVNGVLVGEVWLCSGQSNMNLPLTQAQDAASEIAAANHSLIHYFEVKSAVSDQPQEMADGQWQPCTPETAGTFTAVGYFFARELQRELGVPVGIIKSTLGGSPIEGWLSTQALAGTPTAAAASAAEWKRLAAAFDQRTAEYHRRLADWESRRTKARADGLTFTEPQPARAQERSDRKRPSGLYNGFIRPLEPMTLAGFLWYQGESNAAAPADYRALFPAMIRHWRAGFQQPDLPFLFVQLPGFDLKNDLSGQQWAWFREAQASVLALPKVNMAVTIDVGDSTNLHPANKQEVGRRLALVALRRTYGREVEDSGPVFAGLERLGSTLRLHFTQAAGLHFKGVMTNAFVIAGIDRQFVPAEARIEGEAVIVSAPALPHPVEARYNWCNFPTGFVFNRSRLPATPFRSDNW